MTEVTSLKIILLALGITGVFVVSLKAHGSAWLLGLGKKVDVVIDLAKLGSESPEKVSNKELANAISSLQQISQQLDMRLDLT